MSPPIAFLVSSELNDDLSGDFVRPVFPDSALKRPCPVTVVS